MKAVMISIKPKWCELIANGQKTIEVRKTKPKLKPPFKCYIYCTKASKKHQTISGSMVLNDDELFKHPTEGVKYGNSIELMSYEADRDYNKDNFLNGKVIGEFVCDFIYENISYDSEGTCVSAGELQRYADGKPIFGWHISNLVIYDKPKELNEFIPNCEFLNDDSTCQYEKVLCGWQAIDYNPDNSVNLALCKNRMTRPPQLWCYVEEISNAPF